MPGYCWRRRRRCGRIGRMPKPIAVAFQLTAEKFKPTPEGEGDPVYLDVAEVEALRLIELEKLSFEEAGLRMGVSRNTVWRIVEAAREKLAKAITEGREIIIQR
ncbi:MAG: DUF134 domain-containing protein [Candidatus Bathyarchaeia archaeon]